MQAEPPRDAKRKPMICRRGFNAIEEVFRKKVQQRDQKQIPEHRAQVKAERTVATPQRIVQRQRSRDDRAIALIGGQHAERGRIGEDALHVAEGTHRRIVRDRVEVVEMKAVR